MQRFKIGSPHIALFVSLLLCLGSASGQQIIVKQLSDFTAVDGLEFGIRVFRVDSVTLISSHFREIGDDPSAGSKISTNNGASWSQSSPLQTGDGDAYVHTITPDGTFWYGTTQSQARYRTRQGSILERVMPPAGSTFAKMLGFDRYVIKDGNDVYSLIRGNASIVLPSISTKPPYVDGTTWVAGGQISWDDSETWTNIPKYTPPTSQFGPDLRFPFVSDQRHYLVCGNIGDGRYVGTQYAVKFNRDGSVVQHKGDHGDEGNRTGGYYTWSHQFHNGPLLIGADASNYTYTYDDATWYVVGDADHDRHSIVASSSGDEVILWVVSSIQLSPTLWSIKYSAMTDVADSPVNSPPQLTYDQGSLVMTGHFNSSMTRKYSVYNLHGVLVATCTGHDDRVDCGRLTSGVYFVTVNIHDDFPHDAYLWTTVARVPLVYRVHVLE